MGPARARAVTAAITFDTGALVAIERRSHRMQALLEEIDRSEARIAVPAGVVAQAWRGGRRQARIAAVLSDERTEVIALDDPTARAVGLLSGRSGHPDVVDVSVALCARERGLHVVTSDPDDLRAVDPALILHRP
ncbi:MAG: PIN domain-containing protein [Actinobacteria bacterium]|nr:PIN domain-containing protein [Actinomycetota bacterium]